MLSASRKQPPSMLLSMSPGCLRPGARSRGHDLHQSDRPRAASPGPCASRRAARVGRSIAYLWLQRTTAEAMRSIPAGAVAIAPPAGRDLGGAVALRPRRPTRSRVRLPTDGSAANTRRMLGDHANPPSRWGGEPRREDGPGRLRWDLAKEDRRGMGRVEPGAGAWRDPARPLRREHIALTLGFQGVGSAPGWGRRNFQGRRFPLALAIH
jgi:hypothetical protein